MRKYTVAVVQMDTQSDTEKNYSYISAAVAEARSKGASIAAFPEMMNYIGPNFSGQAETIPGPTSDLLCSLAREYGIWIQTGSITEQNDGGPPLNTTMLINPQGKILCKYSKLHMFDVGIKNGLGFMESSTTLAGQDIVLADTELGTLGFAICYDVRFPELFRLLALEGAEVIFVPSSFSMITGKDHWEPLLRARAIENGCYIVASDQIGRKPKMITYGKSMVIDPWGDVIAMANDRPCCFTAEIDLDFVKSVRSQIPSIENRRGDIYSLTSPNIKRY